MQSRFSSLEGQWHEIEILHRPRKTQYSLWKFDYPALFMQKSDWKKGIHEEEGRGKKWCGVLHLISSRGESKRAEKEAHHSKPQKENETFWTLVEVQGVKLLGEDSLWQELSASKIEWFPLSPTQSYSLSTSLLKKLFNQLLYWLWNFRKLLGEKYPFWALLRFKVKFNESNFGIFSTWSISQ